ncbi:hypothetical protein Tsp_10377 [Trichinella spiralis]|uniref:hypothetical protein n=1 Tax=Trichinella spiralis TaxID=6334 RepID=UPI0001EFEA98|nr:hypothetical protein Tsp_10377 [Trichinella spiralis]
MQPGIVPKMLLILVEAMMTGGKNIIVCLNDELFACFYKLGGFVCNDWQKPVSAKAKLSFQHEHTKRGFEKFLPLKVAVAIDWYISMLSLVQQKSQHSSDSSTHPYCINIQSLQSRIIQQQIL